MKATFRLLLLGILGAWLIPSQAHAQYYNPYAAYYQAQVQQQMWMAQAYSGYGMGGYGMGGYGMGGYGMGYAQPYMQPYMQPVPTTPGSPCTGMPANPYMPTGPGYGITPTPYGSMGYDGYSGMYNPYTAYSAGSVLMGSADVLRGYGSMLTKQEQARLIQIGR